MMTKETINIIERIHGKTLNENEIEEIFFFAKNITNNFYILKNFITDIELLKSEQEFSDFKLQYIEKIKFLHFIEHKIFPLNIRSLMSLNINNFLNDDLISKIEFADRLYTLYTTLRHDLLFDNIETSEDFKIINIQHLYNDFGNPFLKNQLALLEYNNKIDFDYWKMSEKYENKHLAMFNASRIVSAIDLFFDNKIFVYHKKENTKFERLGIKFKEDGRVFSGILKFKEEFRNLSTGWNIILPNTLRILKTPYEFLHKNPPIVKFLGKENKHKSILENSYYTQNIFTKNSRYMHLELLDKERKEKFDNEFILKILNHIQSYPIKIDWNIANMANKSNYADQNKTYIQNMEREICEFKMEKEKTWNAQKQKNKKIKYLYNKIEGIRNDWETNTQIFQMINNLKDEVFFIKYKFCARYRMYPNAGILNYQNFKILRMIFKGDSKTKKDIIAIYREFFNKHRENMDKISKNIFFYNKIKKETYEQVLEILESKLGKKIYISNKKIDELNDIELWDIILANYGYQIIYRMGEFIKKTSTSIDNDSIILNGILVIKNKLINFENLEFEEKIYWKRLILNWKNFEELKVYEQQLYAFDATTSMIQVSSILCFAENIKTLKQCGIIDPFRDGEKIEDIHQTILEECLNNLNDFITKNKLSEYSEIIKKIINRSFVKTVHIPFSYGQSDRTLTQNLNLKHRNNLLWEKIPAKIKKLIGQYIYETTLKIYKKNLPHIIEIREILEEAYRNSSLSLGGEILKMPVETDISDDHIEYSNLLNKLRSIKNNIKKLEKEKELNQIETFFYEEKMKELYNRWEGIEKRLDKIEIKYEKNDLIKRISISSIIWKWELKKFISINKYKVTYLNQSNVINDEKMDRCAYVNTVQNGDATIMLLANKNLMLSTKSKLKITILWTHDCGNISLFFADLLELSYKMAFIEVIEYYMDTNTDPFEREEYKIDKKYLEKRNISKGFWEKNNIKDEIWKSTRLITSEI